MGTNQATVADMTGLSRARVFLRYWELFHYWGVHYLERSLGVHCVGSMSWLSPFERPEHLQQHLAILAARTPWRLRFCQEPTLMHFMGEVIRSLEVLHVFEYGHMAPSTFKASLKVCLPGL